MVTLIPLLCFQGLKWSEQRYIIHRVMYNCHHRAAATLLNNRIEKGRQTRLGTSMRISGREGPPPPRCLLPLSSSSRRSSSDTERFMSAQHWHRWIHNTDLQVHTHTHTRHTWQHVLNITPPAPMHIPGLLLNGNPEERSLDNRRWRQPQLVWLFTRYGGYYYFIIYFLVED